MKLTLKTALLSAALGAAAAATQANAAIPVYPNAGTQNPTTYSITAAANANIVAYFASNTGSYTNLLGLKINGVDTGILGLNNQATAPGTSLNFGPASTGDILTFYIKVLNTGDFFYSNPALNADGVNHVWSTPYAGGDFGIPAGQFITFEDLLGGGDLNYNDLGFVFSNVAINPDNGVPEPASWAMMILGLGAVGAAMRRQAKVRVTYA
jgi:Domain of unknown function (DUF4114)/PEP-CTERM motif